VFIADAYKGSFGIGVVPTGQIAVDDDYSFSELRIEDDKIRMLNGVSFFKERFAVKVQQHEVSTTFPGWLLVIVTATVTYAAYFWKLVRRFSLRTLLIATTLVAVVLGLAVGALA
jgi:hypothetical protein